MNRLKLTIAALTVAALAVLVGACGGEDMRSVEQASNTGSEVTLPELPEGSVPDRTVQDNYDDPNPDTPETAVEENEVPETGSHLYYIEEEMAEAKADKENASTRQEYMDASKRFQERNAERAAYLQGFEDGQGN